MNLDHLSFAAIRDRLVAEARAFGVTVEEHAAAELHKLEAKYGKTVLITGVVCLFVGFVIGKLL